MKKIYLMVFFVILFTIVFVCQSANANPVEWQKETYTVKSGDTLWDIASLYHSSMDIRDYMSLITEENKITGYIQPGQQIIIFVPVDSAK